MDPSERRGTDALGLHILTKLAGLEATVQATQGILATGQQNTSEQMGAMKALLVEKIEAGDKDQATVQRFTVERIAKLEETLQDHKDDIEPRVRRLETWQGRIAGGLALVVVLTPIAVTVTNHLWR